jgi:hypothetical protein
MIILHNHLKNAHGFVFLKDFSHGTIYNKGQILIWFELQTFNNFKERVRRKTNEERKMYLKHFFQQYTFILKSFIPIMCCAISQHEIPQDKGV